MKSRIRAVTPVRSNFAGANKSSVSHFAVAEIKKGSFFKCCLFKSSIHWIVQCHKFKVMSPDEHMKAVKDNHGCFSCLIKLVEHTTVLTAQEESNAMRSKMIHNVNIIIIHFCTLQLTQILLVWSVTEEQSCQLYQLIF